MAVSDQGGKGKKAKPRPIRTESDLWTDPAKGREKEGSKKGGAGVEEISPEEVEELEDEGGPGQEGKKGGLGGWGGQVERDSWGDEERIKAAESIEEKAEEKPKKEAAPDAGQPDAGPQAVKIKAPDETPRDAGPGPAVVGEGLRSQEELSQERVEVLPPSGTLADLSTIWEQRRIHLGQGEFGLARGDLSRFLALKEELGIRNTTLQATVLLREAERALKAKDPEVAEELLNLAARLAPDFAGAHLSRAAFWFSQSPLKLQRVLGGLFDSAQAVFRDPLASSQLFSNLLVGLLLGMGLAASVFVVVQLLMVFRLYLHDFHHLFPRRAARLQTGMLALVIVLIPVIFRMGLLSLLLLWALIAWMYQERFARLVTFLVLVFFTVLPLMVGLLVSGMTFPGSIGGDLAGVARDRPDEQRVARLESRLGKDPDDYTILATLGGLYKRTGRLKLAGEFLERALRVKPDSEVLLNNLGNVLILTNQIDAAVDHYHRAIQLRPDLAVPYYNLSRAYFWKTDLTKGNQHRKLALRLDQDGIRALVERSSSNKGNDVVADLPLPRQWLSAREDGQDGIRWKEAANHIWNTWGGTGSRQTFPYVGLGAMLLFGLMLLFQSRLSLSGACVRCGQPACRRCNRELMGSTSCGQCFHAFVHKDQVDAKSRISKEIQIRQHRQRQESIARGITFVVPGAGQLIKGRPLRGMLFLVVFGCVLVQLLLGDSVLRATVALGAGVDWLRFVPLILLFLGFYVWAILDVFRSKR